jgi:hypothetical protein
MSYHTSEDDPLVQSEDASSYIRRDEGRGSRSGAAPNHRELGPFLQALERYPPTVRNQCILYASPSNPSAVSVQHLRVCGCYPPDTRGGVGLLPAEGRHNNRRPNYVSAWPPSLRGCAMLRTAGLMSSFRCGRVYRKKLVSAATEKFVSELIHDTLTVHQFREPVSESCFSLT